MAVVANLTARTREELDEKVENYFNNFHPAGYGTTLDEVFYDEEADIWKAKLSRLSSCD